MFQRKRSSSMLGPLGKPGGSGESVAPEQTEQTEQAEQTTHFEIERDEAAGAGGAQVKALPEPQPEPEAGKTRVPRGGGPGRRRRPRWQRVLLVCALATLMGAGLGVGFFAGYVRTLPPIDQLEDPESLERTIVLDRTGRIEVGEFKGVNQQFVPLDEIPEKLQNAFLAVEDSRFYQHYGVDMIGIARALKVALETKKVSQGASTFTQQLAKKIVGKRTARNRHDVKLKLEEIFVALQIEKRYSKRQIFELYLNSLDFVNNSFGVKAAASTYFSKTLDELTIAECAVLAGMIQRPGKFDPFRRPQLMTTRRDLVLGRMYDLGYIDEKTYEAALAEPLVTRRNRSAVSKYPQFMSALQMDLKANYEIGTEITTMGLTITGSLDAAIQDACDKALSEGLLNVEREWHSGKPARQTAENKEWNGQLRPGLTKLMRIDRIDTQGTTTLLRVSLSGYRGEVPLPKNLASRFYEPDKIVKEGELIDITVEAMNGGKFTGKLYDTKPVQGSIVVLDAHNGEVLALSTGGYERFGWNGAIQGGRQVGSVFKAFIFAAAMERGFSPASVIVDEPIEYTGGYRPRNYEKNSFFGPRTLTDALSHSRNIITLRLFERLGVGKALEFVDKFDFTRENARWKIDRNMSSCLGTSDFSPFEMAAAYQVFANGGVGVRPQFFSSAVDKSGRAGIPERRKEEPIMDPVAAYQTMYMLRQVVTQGTGKAKIGDRFPTPEYPPICGKTGTTDNCVDASFAGFTPDLSIYVQVGFENGITSLGVKMTGSRLAAPIWADAFAEIYKTRENWKMSFDAPPGGVDLVTICGNTGKRVGDACSSWSHAIFANAPFRKGTAPTDYCDGDPQTPIIAPVGADYGYLAANAGFYGSAYRPSVIETVEEDLE